MRRILVKGAGMAGLTVAHELAARGASVTVAEIRSQIGGNASWLADGMLAPWCERESAEEAVVTFGNVAADWGVVFLFETGEVGLSGFDQVIDCAHPAFGEAEIVETGVGVRPAYPHNLPRVKRWKDGTITINGLYRHGFLLSPAMAEQAASVLFNSSADKEPENELIVNGEALEAKATTLDALLKELDYEGGWLATALNASDPRLTWSRSVPPPRHQPFRLSPPEQYHRAMKATRAKSLLHATTFAFPH